MSDAPDLVVGIVLDESGSMGSRCTETISGYNTYLSDLKKDNVGKNVLFSLTKFQTTLEMVHTAESLSGIPDLSSDTYTPGGMTALYDAVAKTVLDMESRVDKDSKALVVIMTDGGENSSLDYSGAEGLKSVRNLLTKKTKENNWSFIFLGVDADAWDVGASLGAGHSFQFNANNMKGTMQKISAGTTAYATAASAGVGDSESLTRSFSNAYDNFTQKDIDDITKKSVDKLKRNLDLGYASGIDPKETALGAESLEDIFNKEDKEENA